MKKIFLAPMADLSVPPLRREIRRMSRDVVLYSEMISAAALLRGGLRNDYLTEKHPFDDPLSFQIIGNDPDIMAGAAEIIERKNPYSVDINMGCSAPEIISKGWGSALMNDSVLAARIVRECRKKVKRLSVKCRAGFKRSDYGNLFSFVNMLRDEGADYITVHPRSSDIAFKRLADWSLVERLSDETSAVIIGNGDISDHEAAVRRMNSCRCGGIMIGRTAVKQPWIFAMIDAKIRNISFDADRLETCLNIIDGMKSIMPDEIKESRLLKFCAYFCTDLKFGHSLFTEIRKNPMDAEKYFAAYFGRNPHERPVSSN